ncbi:MAG: hypothetical protein LM632_12710 [Armatimonadetes bacterium]|nr:hypothetical protein [Armatimonadota bacterium]
MGSDALTEPLLFVVKFCEPIRTDALGTGDPENASRTRTVVPLVRVGGLLVPLPPPPPHPAKVTIRLAAKAAETTNDQRGRLKRQHISINPFF